MNKNPPRIRAFIFAGIALLALVLLAASLNSLKLAEGQPFPIEQLAPPVFDNSVPAGGMSWVLAAFRVIMILAWISLLVYMILLFVNKEERKRFLRNLLIWLPFALLLLYIVTRRPNPNAPNLGESLTGGYPAPVPVGTTVPPPEYVPPAPWVTTLTTLIIALVIALALLSGFYILWRQARNRRQLKEPLKMVEKEARVALDAIVSGSDLREVVIRCYLQMIEALQAYRGINRDQNITPHEFEQILAKRGVPGEPVHQLTLLFEEVRYGTFRPGRIDEQTAIASLSAIISACQRVAERRG